MDQSSSQPTIGTPRYTLPSLRVPLAIRMTVILAGMPERLERQQDLRRFSEYARVEQMWRRDA